MVEWICFFMEFNKDWVKDCFIIFEWFLIVVFLNKLKIICSNV